MVVALDDEGDAQGVAGVSGDGETDGVGTIGGRELGAVAASVPQITERPKGGVVGSRESARGRAAQAGPGISEGQHGVADVGSARPALDGEEIRARHISEVW